MPFIITIRSPQSIQIKNAELLLKLFKKHIDSSYYCFAATSQENKFYWSYYLLRENYLNRSFWIKTEHDMSPNEKAIDVLMEYYIQHSSELSCALSEKETNVLNNLIASFYERLQIISTVPESNQYIFEPFVGSVRLEG
jgi:hypothetical protein